MIIKSKKAFEFSFAWMFAILVGAVILFFALYATSRLVTTSQYQQNTITTKQLSIIFEPLEVGLASGKSNIARLNEETRIFNKCYDSGTFGEQRFSLSSKSSFGSSWSARSADIPLTNKYIFSNSSIQGKEISLLSMPFNFPWKVSEIILMTTDSYCLEDAPDEIKNKISFFKNFKISNCTSKDIKVCFYSKCDITVKGTCTADCDSPFDSGYLTKKGKTLFYSGDLLFAAIISSPDIYECNIKRLMKRLFQQSLLFQKESSYLSSICGSLSFSSLAQLTDQAKSLSKSENLLVLSSTSNNLKTQNEGAQCSLW